MGKSEIDELKAKLNVATKALKGAKERMIYESEFLMARNHPCTGLDCMTDLLEEISEALKELEEKSND